MTSTLDRPTTIAPDRWVDNRVYHEPEVFDAEVERIFERVWQFACHESEIPAPGDFVTLVLAGTPVVVNRDEAGKVHAFFNTCRHRGSMVVNEASGNCSAFQCPYHSWVYSLEGELIKLPGEEAYDGTGFDKERFPLVELACDSIFGLVFVSMGDEPVSLQQWLGDPVIEVLRKPLGMADFAVTSSHADELDVNWKIFAENARDGYHVPFVHPFLRAASPPGRYDLFDNGHAVQYLGMDPNGIEPDLWKELEKFPLPGLEVGEGYIMNLFPDFSITVRSNVVSLDYQSIHGPTKISMQNRTLGLVGDTPEAIEVREFSQRVWFADPVRQEDYPIFGYQQAGVASRKVRYSIVARGADAMTGTRGDDNRLRHFWVAWREQMGVSLNSLNG